MTDLNNIKEMVKRTLDKVVGESTQTCTPTCLPFYIYAGISLISIVGGLFMGTGSLVSRLGRALIGALWSTLWAGLIYFLCGRCQQGWSWFVLLLPTILMGLSVLFLILAKTKTMSYKVTFVGNSNVGKSSLFQRILKNRFYEQRESTIGGAYMKHVTPSNTYEVWDTAGQERYNALIPIYIRDSDIVIFVYDVTDSASFAAVTEHWLPFVSKSLQRRETDTLFILIGNKCDVGDVGNNDSNSEKGADILHRQVHTKQGKDLVENGNFNYFLETSAKQGLATEGIFQVMDDYIAQTRRAPNCSYYSTNTPSLQLSLDALNDRDRTHSSSSCANSC